MSQSCLMALAKDTRLSLYLRHYLETKVTEDKLEEVKQILGNLPLSEEAKQRAEKLVDASVSTWKKEDHQFMEKLLEVSSSRNMENNIRWLVIGLIIGAYILARLYGKD